MGGPVAKATSIGAAQGALESAILFLVSEKYTIANDWFLAVMIVLRTRAGSPLPSDMTLACPRWQSRVGLG